MKDFKMDSSLLLKKYGGLPQYHLNSHLVIACACGQLSHIKYLLSSKELAENADIHCDEDYPFISTCLYGYLQPDAHVLISYMLKNNFSEEQEYDELLNYFINELHLKKTNHISSFLEKIKPNNEEFYDKIERMFSIQELNEKLNKSLPIKQQKNDKIIKQ